jgi:pimeloyl-ACP methyl ester carboxylesterase
LAAKHPDRVSHLALLGAVRAPAEAGRQAQRDRAATVREKGMIAVAPTVVANATSEATRRDQPVAAALVRELVLRQDPEGYARSCLALAGATDPGPVSSDLPLLLLTGDEDKVGPPEAGRELADAHGGAIVEVFGGCGHWTAAEKPFEVTERLLKFF